MLKTGNYRSTWLARAASALADTWASVVDPLPTVESSEAQRQVTESNGHSVWPLADKYSV